MMSCIRPNVKVISEEVITRVIEQATMLLENTGVFIENVEARAILLDSGAVEDKKRIKIPASLVEKAVSTAPSSITLYDRAGQEACILTQDNVLFDPGSAALKIFDRNIGSPREALLDDVVKFSRLTENLVNFKAQSTGLVPSDIPKIVSDITRLYIALINCRKPVITGTFHTGSFDVIFEMLCVIRGGSLELRDKPLAILDCCPSPPLKWSNLTCQDLIDCAKKGIPSELVSMPLTGATSPVTLLGAVVQHCAESMSGVTICQLVSSGAPIIYGGSPALFDMRHGTTPMGAIETMMIDIANSQVAKRLGLPTHAYMALSDAKIPDAQAGLESGMGALLGALAGINMISGPGMLDFENCQCLEKLVIDNEICGMVMRMLRGIDVRDEDLGAALLQNIDEAPNFLTHPHTLKWFRHEAYYPGAVIDRQVDIVWEQKGKKDILVTAGEEIEKLLKKEIVNPLDPAYLNELSEIMRKKYQSLGIDFNLSI